MIAKYLNHLLHLPQVIFFNVLSLIYDFLLCSTAAEIYGIRLLKAGSAAQSKGCSACFVLVIKCAFCMIL